MCALIRADNFTLGLAWNVTNGQSIDLDASCIYLDSELQVVDQVSRWDLVMFRRMPDRQGY